MAESPLTNCPHCMAPLPPGALVCPTCNHLVFEARIKDLLENSQRLESLDPMYAAALLNQAMNLVPPGSQPHQMLAAKAAALSTGAFGGTAPAAPRVLNYAPPETRNDSWSIALLKTGGSMALSIAIYHYSYGWTFAIGFVVLILIHELGHVLANAYYGLKQSPPIFIPYMGAVIWLRQNPPSAKAEAVIGIAGPIAGTLGALACYLVAGQIHDFALRSQLTQVAAFAFIMNLFNLIPCPPLDGGRVAAAITPLLWIPGVIAFIGVIWKLGGGHLDFVTILMALWILQSALPRLRQALLQGGRKSPYYRLLPTERAMITFSYLLLGVVLVAMLVMLFTPHLLLRTRG
jgi:Zn-dependent protease